MEAAEELTQRIEDNMEGEIQKALSDLKKSSNLNKDLQHQLETAMDRTAMLEEGMNLKTTTTQRIVKEAQDSIEIGAQATGRVKVYGDYGKKSEFAAKIKDALELLEATRGTLEKANGAGEGKKKEE